MGSFLLKNAEEALYVAVGAAAVVLADADKVDKAVLTVAAVAAGRAVLGLLIRNLGRKDSPSVM